MVPLADAVKMLHAGGPPEKLVAITFDDGYLDNATTAAPILKELDVPATFFISTDMIGGGRPFPHDVLRDRVPQDHMSWDDVRSLAAQGFDIGSHTCSHADLGAVSLRARAAPVARAHRSGAAATGRAFLFSLRPPSQPAARYDGSRATRVRGVLLGVRRPQSVPWRPWGDSPHRGLVRRDVPRVSGLDRGMADAADREHTNGASGRGRCACFPGRRESRSQALMGAGTTSVDPSAR